VKQLPAILVSYAYYKPFARKRQGMRFRNWSLDSGAYTAWNIGKEVDLDEYISFCKRMAKSDPSLVEIIALDVIGCAKGSLKNSLKMKSEGVDAMPVFHIGDDFGILKEYMAGWDKVGLSCRFGEPVKESLRFYDKCFAAGWPKKFHSFGWVSDKMLFDYPFHSSDASSWSLQPTAYGAWKEFGRIRLRGSNMNILSNVHWFLDLEARLTEKWGPLFEKQGWDRQVDVRLANNSNPVAVKALRGIR
jgi:hypothetical protein